ncbi:MAG: hypothetical protein ICV64_00515 [Thermoleophilia bacterium]|nr:hypothetical protein [Thermoleophilia bacterium]
MAKRAADWIIRHTINALAGTGFLAVIASVLGFWTQLEPPWNYTFAYGVAALLLAAALWYWRTHGWQLPPPWGKSYKPGVTQGSSFVTASLTVHGVAITPSADFSVVRFDLLGQPNQRVPTGRPARAVEFLEPTHTIVQPPLPKRVRWRLRTIAVVKSFTDDEMILDSYAQGVSAKVQVYHDKEGD